jgi:hypothetical protein
MAFSFLYLVVRALFGALVRSRRGLHAKDIELLVMRHELEFLRALRTETQHDQLEQTPQHPVADDPSSRIAPSPSMA